MIITTWNCLKSNTLEKRFQTVFIITFEFQNLGYHLTENCLNQPFLLYFFRPELFLAFRLPCNVGVFQYPFLWNSKVFFANVLLVQQAFYWASVNGGQTNSIHIEYLFIPTFFPRWLVQACRKISLGSPIFALSLCVKRQNGLKRVLFSPIDTDNFKRKFPRPCGVIL